MDLKDHTKATKKLTLALLSCRVNALYAGRLVDRKSCSSIGLKAKGPKANGTKANKAKGQAGG